MKIAGLITKIEKQKEKVARTRESLENAEKILDELLKTKEQMEFKELQAFMKEQKISYKDAISIIAKINNGG